MRLGTIVLVSLALAGGAHAQQATNPLYVALGSPENWTISGSFRVRGEVINNDFRPAPIARNDAFLSLRTTLFAQYDAGPVRFGAELFDSRGYFEKSRSSVANTEINAVELGQAYVAFDFGQPTATRTSLEFGRFTIDDGSRRLVARNAFRNTINSFTGGRLDLITHAGDKLLLFYTLPQVRLPDAPSSAVQSNRVAFDRESDALTFYGGSYTKTGIFGGTAEVYGYQLDEHDTPSLQTRDRHLFTPGLRIARTPKTGKWDWDFEVDYQTGRSRATTAITDRRDLDTEAYFFHTEVGRSFAAPWQPRIAVQYDRASGNGTNPARYTRFDTLFGARRGEYGPTSLYGAVQRANLSSPALRIEGTPNKRFDGFVAWRPLWLENRTDSFASTGVRDRLGQSGLFAGNQVEGRIRYWVVPKIARLDGGFAYLVKDRFLETAPNAPRDGDTRYGYLDMTFTF